MKLAEAIAVANHADDEFEAAIKAAGYKSRWDWSQLKDRRPLYAYIRKVQADELVHRLFEESR